MLYMSDVHPSTYQKYGLSNVVKECEKRGVTKNKRERERDRSSNTDYTPLQQNVPITSYDMII